MGIHPVQPTGKHHIDWRRHAWLVALVSSPLLLGSVTNGGQAVVAVMLGTSMLMASHELGKTFKCHTSPALRLLALSVLLVPLVPLPTSVVALLSPETHRLGLEFARVSGKDPSFMTMTLSPAGTVQRLWELALFMAVFMSARHSAADEKSGRPFAMATLAALALLAASDVRLRSGDGKSILGIWPLNWGNAAGTFANRNHFASWCVVGGVFAMGWFLRSVQPLRRARHGASPSTSARRHGAHVSLLIVLFALVMALLTGSRGAMLAAAAAGTVWIMLFLRHASTGRRWVIACGGLVLGGLLLAAFGGTVIDRLLQSERDLAAGYPKLVLWKDVWTMAWKFPLFGIGPGAFLPVFNHFKTFGGEMTFHHAENDYLQWLAEHGLVGATAFILLMGCLLLPPVRHACARDARFREPELFIAAIAALAGFAVHALVEFISHIPANGMLASAMAGYLVGAHESAGSPKVPPPISRPHLMLNVFCSVCLVGGGVLMGASSIRWDNAEHFDRLANTTEAGMQRERALRLWPWNSHRQSVDARESIARIIKYPAHDRPKQVAALRRHIIAALAADPLNWELRYQLAWLEMLFNPDPAAGYDEALLVLRLNPLQPELPAVFARHFAGRDPDKAWQLLEEARLESRASLQKALAVAWSLPGDRSRLWNLVGTETGAMQVFVDEALERGASRMAVQGCQKLVGSTDAAWLMNRLLKAGRPDLALARLPETGRTPEQWLLGARAAFGLGSFEQSVVLARGAWSASGADQWLDERYPVLATSAELEQRWQGGDLTLSTARQLAESIHAKPPDQRRISLLRAIRHKHPRELRVLWMLHRALWEAGQEREGAEVALELAEQAVERSG